MTDRYCIRAVRGAERPGRVRAVSRYTADSRDRVFAAVDMVALVSARTELRRAGVNSYFGLCPFHDERTRLVPRPARTRSTTTASAARPPGDPFNFVMETEGLDFKAALESLADRFGVKLETEDEDPGRRRAPPAPRAAVLAAGPRRRLLLALPVGGARGRAGARATCSAAGSTRRRCASSGSATRRAPGTGCCCASRRAGFSDEELLATGLAQRSQEPPRPGLRPLPRADHVPGRRRPRPRARLRRPRDAREPAAQVPQHLRRRALPQARGPVRDRPRPRARPRARGG